MAPRNLGKVERGSPGKENLSKNIYFAGMS